MASLTVTGLCKRFGGIQAVRDCSFEARHGEITALIGPNGAGKTTVFNMITGLVRPDAGSIALDGEQLVGLRPFQIAERGVARTFQMSRTLRQLTVLENVAVAKRRWGWRSFWQPDMTAAEREEAMALLELVGLAPLRDEPAGHLSYGQQKLLELVGAVMAGAQIILLDEPVGGVNPRMIDLMSTHIRRLNREAGITFLIVEHTMDFVMQLSHRVIVMAQGTVIASGTPKEIQSNPAVLEAYLGRSATP